MTPKLCKDCKYYVRMVAPRGGYDDKCKRKPIETFDPVHGPTTVYRDCREYRQSHTQPGSWPTYGYCGVDAKFWEPA